MLTVGAQGQLMGRSRVTRLNWCPAQLPILIFWKLHFWNHSDSVWLAFHVFKGLGGKKCIPFTQTHKTGPSLPSSCHVVTAAILNDLSALFQAYHSCRNYTSPVCTENVFTVQRCRTKENSILGAGGVQQWLFPPKKAIRRPPGSSLPQNPDREVMYLYGLNLSIEHPVLGWWFTGLLWLLGLPGSLSERCTFIGSRVYCSFS